MKVRIQEMPPVMDVGDVAEYLRVSRVTVRQMLRDGRLKGFKAGREWRIARSSVEELLLQQQAVK